MRVLIVENSRMYLQFLARLFDDLGFESVGADDVDSALDQLGSDSFNLVCSNLHLRGSDPVDFLARFRAATDGTPILVLTSDRSDRVRKRALTAGATEILYKASVPEMSASIGGFVRQRLRAEIDRARVLYVEDSRTEAIIVTRLLKSMSLAVDHCNSAERAIELLSADDYDLVISDVLLKGEMSGLALVSHIRALPERKSRIPVLTVTGFDDVARRIELLRAGTNDYIVKPVIREELSVRVTNLIRSKKLFDKVMEQQEQLRELAITDPLTGCLNRRGFNEYSETYLAHEAAHDQAVGLLMIDLDYFKKINDRYGHKVGDQVLSAVGGLLLEKSRGDDVVGRLGGEEFAMLLADSSKSATVARARRLLECVEELCPAGRRITTSIGVTSFPAADYANLDVPLNTADKAVYRAKTRGRNCVSFKAI